MRDEQKMELGILCELRGKGHQPLVKFPLLIDFYWSYNRQMPLNAHTDIYP